MTEEELDEILFGIIKFIWGIVKFVFGCIFIIALLAGLVWFIITFWQIIVVVIIVLFILSALRGDYL